MTLIDERTGGLDRALGAAKRQNAVARFIFILNAPRHAGQSDHCARELAPSESTHAVVCVTRAPIRASFAFTLAQDSIPADAALRHRAWRRGLARMTRTPQLQSGNVGEDTVRCKPLAPRGTGSDGSRLHRRGNIPPIAKARCVWVYATLFLSRPLRGLVTMRSVQTRAIPNKRRRLKRQLRRRSTTAPAAFTSWMSSGY